MNWLGYLATGYAALAVAEIGLFAWSYLRQPYSPQVDVTGDALGDVSRIISESPYSGSGP